MKAYSRRRTSARIASSGNILVIAFAAIILRVRHHGRRRIEIAALRKQVSKPKLRKREQAPDLILNIVTVIALVIIVAFISFITCAIQQDVSLSRESQR